MTRVIFMGTPAFAVPTLEKLIENFEVVGVVTQPDRPAGRDPEPRPSPVKVAAEQHGIPVFQPEKIRKPEAIAELKKWGDVDLYVVAAFGQILPQEVLDIPKHGSINVHASLLPRWRGASPIQAAIRHGDQITGITIMKMDAGLDTGPMLSQGSVTLGKKDTATGLHDRLARLGAMLLVQTIPGYLSGAITPQPQDESAATYAPQIKKEDGRIDWSQDARQIEQMVRAFTPWPGTYTYWGDTLIKILEGTYGDGRKDLPAGTIYRSGKNVWIQTGTESSRSSFHPQLVQMAGKTPTSMEALVNGHPGMMGAQLK